MKRRKWVLVGLAIGVLIAPSASSAHSPVSGGSVGAHVRSAKAALSTVAKRVAAHDDAGTAAAVVDNLRQMKSASREAARIRDRAKRAKALGLVAARRNANVQTLARLVDDAGAAGQVALAQGLTSNLAGRESAVAKLTALAAKLPLKGRAGLATTIVAVAGHGEDELSDIVAAINSGKIVPAALPTLQQAQALTSSSMFTGLDHLLGLVGLLPPTALAPVTASIDHVTEILQIIFGAAAPGSTLPTGLPIPCGVPILSILQLAPSC